MSRIENCNNRIDPTTTGATDPHPPAPTATPRSTGTITTSHDDFAGPAHGHPHMHSNTPRTATARVAIPSPSPPPATVAVDRSVSAYVNAYRAHGAFPAAPQIAPLPTMTGEQVLGRVGEQRSHSLNRALERALRERDELTPHTLVQSAASLVPRSVREIASDLGRVLYDHMPAGLRRVMPFEAFMAEALPSLTGTAIESLETVHTAAEVIGAALPAAMETIGGIAARLNPLIKAYEIANAFYVYGQELNNVFHGRISASPSVLAGMRDEIALRTTHEHAAAVATARTSFQSAVSAAARGELPPAPPGSDRAAWALGLERGAAYRRTHGDAFNQLAQHVRACTGARAQLGREAAGPFGHVPAFTPLNEPPRTTIGARIVIPPPLDE